MLQNLLNVQLNQTFAITLKLFIDKHYYHIIVVIFTIGIQVIIVSIHIARECLWKLFSYNVQLP